MKALLTVALIIAVMPAFAQVHVNGYTTKNGSYVAPHERTAPNKTNLDNYSTKGNINPYTGQPGTKAPDQFGVGSVPAIQPIQPLPPIQSVQPQQQVGNPYGAPQPSPKRF
jgi:hypothetical protein